MPGNHMRRCPLFGFVKTFFYGMQMPGKCIGTIIIIIIFLKKRLEGAKQLNRITSTIASLPWGPFLPLLLISMSFSMMGN